MNLKNKTVLFLGDSITEGVGVSSADNNYVSIFQRLCGANVVNYGKGGTRIAKQKIASECPQCDCDFLDRVEEMQDDADVIVVFGGVNDFGNGDAEFGSMKSDSPYTFYGALHVLCNKLLNKYPYAEIVFLTPLHWIGEDCALNKAGKNTPPLSEYVLAIQKVAGYYGLPVLDLFHTSGLQPKINTIKEKYMPDGLHPSDEGARRIAQRLFAFLNTLE